MDDPLGDELALYIQGATTLLLATVTTSYVLLTYKIAETGERQLALAASSRRVDALTELWNQHCELQPVVRDALADIRTMRNTAQRDINEYGIGIEQRRARFAALRRFEPIMARAIIHLDENENKVAVALMEQYRFVAEVGELLDAQINGEIVHGTSNGRGGFDVKRLAERWDTLSELIFEDLPTWDELRTLKVRGRMVAARNRFAQVVKDRLSAPNQSGRRSLTFGGR
jgi:hypothetical protein